MASSQARQPTDDDQARRRAGPVPLNGVGASDSGHPSQGDGNHDRVVDVAEDGDEVGHDVGGHGEVAAEQPQRASHRAGQARVAAGGGDDRPPRATYFDQHIIDPNDASYLNRACPKADAHAMGDIRYEILTTDIRPEMRDIRCPVQYIAAGKPWIKAPEDVASLTEFYLHRIGEIADLEFVIAEEARHFVMVDDPRFFLQVVHRFLAKVPE